MAYEVTKRIKGREYRYVVEAYRDPETKRRKARWQYIGVIDNGKVTPPSATRESRKRVTRDEIISETARLLEFRDPEYVTVSVILARTGASRSTFYRYFPNHQQALSAALARIADNVIRSLPPLDEPQNLQDAKEQLRQWCEALYRCVAGRRGLQRALLHGYSGHVRVRFEPTLQTEDVTARLSTFLQQIHDAGFATIENPVAMTNAIKGIHVALRAATLLTPQSKLPLPEYEDVYPLIERSVFGAQTAHV